MIRLTLLLFLFCLPLATASAVATINADIQEKYIPSTLYTVKNGLLSNFVSDLVQDGSGFIWLATDRGLSRYDSINFLNFIKDKSNPFSIPGVAIQEFILMPNNEIWLSIENAGITIFNQTSQKFTSKKNTHSNLFHMPNKTLLGMSRDKNDNAWFSLYGEGVYQWNVQEQQFYKHTQNDENAWLHSNVPYEVYVDSQNRLWVGTLDSKIFLYHIDDKTSLSFNLSTDVNDAFSNPFYGFAESRQGQIYINGYSGVYKYDENSQSFDHIISSDKLTQYIGGKHLSVTRVFEDSNDNLWIGTSKALFLYKNDVLSRVKFYNDEGVLDSISRVLSIMEDVDGNIWIGTIASGMYKIASDWNRYHIYISEKQDDRVLRSPFQFQDNIWVAHSSANIDLLAYKEGHLQLIKTLVPELGSGSMSIDSIFQDKLGVIWVSSPNGIHKINTHTGKSKAVIDEQGRKIGNVNLIYRGSDNKLYFYLLSDSAIGYFDEEEMVAHYIENSDDNHFKGDAIFQMQSGLDGNVWMATNYGIETLNLATQEYTVIYQSPLEQSHLSFYFNENSNDVWLILDGGLHHLLWDGQKLLQQQDKYNDILPLIRFHQIRNYQDGILLISTQESGLVTLNTETLEYQVFTKENGLPSDTILDVFTNTETDLIITDSGIAYHNEAFINKAPIKPMLVIDHIEQGNRQLPIKPKEPLIFKHDYGSINFDLALLLFSNSSIIEYEYILEGLNDKWVKTGNDDKYSFLNLGAGNYTFKARSRSHYGLWSNVVSYPFRVKPPPWKTIWAYVLYACGFFAIILWLLYLYKRKFLYELEISNQQAQKRLANAASEAKSNFLARVSHEVRTPLNGVLGMGELMLDTKMNEEQRIYAESIMTSGEHLLEIINDILDLSKIEAGKLELDLQNFDLLEIIDETVRAFTSQAKYKKLLFTCEFKHDIIRPRIGDVLRIRQILFNLLSNAFKFTEEGRVSIVIEQALDDENAITMTITDTGIGIDEKVTQRMYEPFVQADTTITRKYGGTGLGLAIVKQLAEKMGGEITARGIINKGSIFTLKLHLPTDTQAQNNSKDLNGTQVCLFIKQPDLKQSILEYLKRLNVGNSNVMTAKIQCVFIDSSNGLSTGQQRRLTLALKQKLTVYLIDFSYDNVKLESLQNTQYLHLITPPITYNEIYKRCAFDTDQDKPHSDRPRYSLTGTDTSLKILVVEDNSINQQVSIEMLEKMGHIVDVVDNAEEGLVMLGRNKYDLLFVDYHLPAMDGLSMIKTWQNKPGIPIIVLTADLTDKVYRECQKLDIVDIIAKPYSQLTLFTVIEKALSKN